jgi:hypothetical protein
MSETEHLIERYPKIDLRDITPVRPQLEEIKTKYLIEDGSLKTVIDHWFSEDILKFDRKFSRLIQTPEYLKLNSKIWTWITKGLQFWTFLITKLTSVEACVNMAFYFAIM